MVNLLIYISRYPFKHEFTIFSKNSLAYYSIPNIFKFGLGYSFYETVLFKESAILLAAGLIFYLIKSYYSSKNLKIKLRNEELIVIKQKKEKEILESELKRKISEIKLLTIKSQINPHFIFNFLSLIKYNVLSEKYDIVTDIINKFSMYLRLSLEQNNNETTNLETELKITETFIELEQLRHKNAFSYQFTNNSEHDLNKIKIPPLILQPFVENAIWYGLLPQEGIKILKIVIEDVFENNAIKISIFDNGIGKAKSLSKTGQLSKKQHFGLNSTKDRLELYFKTNHKRITINLNESQKVGGTEVVFLVYSL